MTYLSAQPWSNGNLIPFGISAMGTTALLTSKNSVDKHKPQVQNFGLFPNGLYSASYRGGALRGRLKTD